MMIRARFSVLALALALAAGCQCETRHRDSTSAMHHHDGESGMMHAATPAGNWSSLHEAVAMLYPTKGSSASGTIHFAAVDTAAAGTQEGLRIHGTITGLEPNSVHAFHIHEFGDASSADGMSAGGHYNPEGHHHGAPDAMEHHAGDLGNVKADASGSATIDMTVTDLSIAGTENPILGRAVVLHGKPDDMTSQPAGNAGPRIAVGVIGVAKSK